MSKLSDIMCAFLWIVVAIGFFLTPTEHHAPNWVVGLMSITFVLININAIMEKYLKYK